MRVSIIIPTLNEESHIVETVRSLQRLSGEKEIIVVDGGSTDRTVPLALAQGVRVLRAPQGRGPQLHVGALNRPELSCGLFMLILLLRQVPSSTSVRVLRSNLRSPAISACSSMAGRVRQDN
jgi:glycosyltransferase involved in cell wall biosynthesis